MEKPKIKDTAILAYVQELEHRLSKFESSPYCDTYLAILKQITDWNDQLTKSRIDLFADKDEKGFDRTFKYFVDVATILKSLDDLRKLMTPEEQKLTAIEQANKEMGTAEKLFKLNGKG